MPTPSALLRRAAELVHCGWSQRKLARTATSKPTTFSDDEAVKFCPYGGTSRATYELGNGQRIDQAETRSESVLDERSELVETYLGAVKALRTVIARKTGEQPEAVDIAGWNDAPDQTAEAVASTLREAAREAEATERRTQPPPPPGVQPPSVWANVGRMLEARDNGTGWNRKHTAPNTGGTRREQQPAAQPQQHPVPTP